MGSPETFHLTVRGAYGADPEHPNRLGRAQVLRPSVPERCTARQGRCALAFHTLTEPRAVRQKCRSYVL